MGFWSWLRPSSPSSTAPVVDGPADDEVAPIPPSEHAPSDVAPPAPAVSFAVPSAHAHAMARLAAFGEADGPSEDEAVDLLRVARATSGEGLALDRLVQANARRPLPRRLAVAVATALLDRGERAPARELLAITDDPSALLLRADLLAEDGDLAGAVATIERVLLRDLDLPGARERRQGWRARLGLAEQAHRIDPATETVAVPRARAPFDLVREVGRGGAGVVYSATDRELGRTVALKIYHRPERDRAQLLHEARVAVALGGAGIVRVFDVEPDEGWLALEWASLGALRDVLRRDDRTTLAPLDAWLPDLARSLARVHAAGWVHHDVKPANVLVTAGPAPWLSDFGNARRIGEPSPPGSFGYVSPERLAGRASDPRDDVYALGRVIEDALAALTPLTLLPDPGRWRALAARCLGADDVRPRDAGEVVASLVGEG